jgi:large subunit ribosomal protein L24
MKRANKRLKLGDLVIVTAGGNDFNRKNKGKTGKIIAFKDDRVFIEGLNLVAKHKRASGPNAPGGKSLVEAPVHLSNVSFYDQRLGKALKLSVKTLADGKKVRGYISPETEEFVQIA